MGRRIEIELTSVKDDGEWTWRAAGAKQPKGDLGASLLYEGAKVGDVVKVEAEFHLDGIEVTEVFAPKQKKERSNLLEMKTRQLRDDELVTTQRVNRDDRRGDRKDRGKGRGRNDGRNEGRGQRGERGEGRGQGGERRGPRPEADRRPRPKRLRPRREHREALLASVAEEHRPIVEQVIKDGMPGVRAAIEKQNAEAKEAGKPEVDASPILAIAEKNLAQARLAEWRDRADAALADADELDIRDLRSVVVAGGDIARDEETRTLVEKIKSVLDKRLESDHAAWLADLDSAVSDGRVVRGLRLSSRPVKAGAPLPTEVASKLSRQASEALAPDIAQDRWATVLDALAFSPVRGAVTPVGVPAEPTEELLKEVRRLSDRIPAIAALFGIDPAEVPKSAKRRRPPRKGQPKPKGGQGGNQGGGKGGDRAERSGPKPAHPGTQPKPEPTPEATSDAPSDAAQAAPVSEQAPAAETGAPATEPPATEDAAAETAAAEPAENAEASAPSEPEPGAEAPAESAEPAVAETPAETPAQPAEAPAEVEAPAGGEAPVSEAQEPAESDPQPAE